MPARLSSIFIFMYLVVEPWLGHPDDRKEVIILPKIELRKEEGLDKALRKFKSKLRREGVLEEMRKREFYEKPSQRRRRAEERAKRRERARTREEW